MNGFNLNSLAPATNPLAQYLQQYLPQEQPQPEQKRNDGGITTYEITSKADIEYIEPDKSGRVQMFDCPNESRVYRGRFNHVSGKMDFTSFLKEDDVQLFQKQDTSAELGQVADALSAVLAELKSMNADIQELKKQEIPVVEAEIVSTGRRPNGQFKKKGES